MVAEPAFELVFVPFVIGWERIGVSTRKLYLRERGQTALAAHTQEGCGLTRQHGDEENVGEFHRGLCAKQQSRVLVPSYRVVSLSSTIPKR